VTTAHTASRHRSRELALQVLFALDIEQQRSRGEVKAQEVFERVAASFEMPEGAKTFAKELVCECQARRTTIDQKIAAHSRNWRVERMAAVDRNVLRLATYELCFTPTPAAVVLDEAVELARRFGDLRSPSFVNGIADAIAHEVGASGEGGG
jgi:N utilization substance protein B